MSSATHFRKMFAGATLEIDDLLLLEPFQISLLPGWVPERPFAAVLAARPEIARFLKKRCPQVAGFVDRLLREHAGRGREEEHDVAACGEEVVWTIADLLVYNTCPEVYDALAFHQWDFAEVTSLADLGGKTVLDCGSGTGRVALEAAETASAVYAVEPVERLRRFIRDKAAAAGRANVYVVDGFSHAIPFADRFADVVLTSHALGWRLDEELAEFERVVKRPGVIIHCPGTADNAAAEDTHRRLVGEAWRYRHARYDEADGPKRKYWKHLD
jgi:hypothetical protein